MSKEVFTKFEELLRTDISFQTKLRQAAEQYSGDSGDEKAIFENLLLPVAQEYGLSASYEEFRDYMKAITSPGNEELSENELEQVAGGKGGGAGVGFCLGIGTGIGGGGATAPDIPVNGGLCAMIGIGVGGYSCFGSGESTSP